MDLSFLTQEEKRCDEMLSKMAEEEDQAGFMKMSSEFKIPPEVARKVFEGITKKDISEEGKMDSEDLGKYIPTYEEFVAYIGHLDQKSAGGPSGLIPPSAELAKQC